jgi:hypothetical protein
MSTRLWNPVPRVGCRARNWCLYQSQGMTMRAQSPDITWLGRQRSTPVSYALQYGSQNGCNQLAGFVLAVLVFRNIEL